MSDVFAKAFAFILIITLGYVLKRRGILRKEDRGPILNLVFYITLPCILISGFKTFEYSHSLFFAIFIGIFANFGIFFVTYLTSLRLHSGGRKNAMMVPSGFSIGTFTIPFAATFLGSESLIIIAMFDIGNAIVGLGGLYALIAAVTGSEERGSLIDFFKRLFTSIPFITYSVMLIISLLGLTLPNEVYIITDIIGSGTIFLVMVVIGIMLEFDIQKDYIKEVIRLLFTRYIAIALMVLILYFLLPLSLEVKKILIICLLAPPSTNSIIFSQKLGCPAKLISAVQSISIPISLIATSLLLLIWH